MRPKNHHIKYISTDRPPRDLGGYDCVVTARTHRGAPYLEEQKEMWGGQTSLHGV